VDMLIIPSSRPFCTPQKGAFVAHGHVITQVFEVNEAKSMSAVLTSIVTFAASLYLIHISPWYLLPFAWALSGTAFTGVRGWGGG
jgi:hypothetical protein